jgi:diadenosine tetraphosphate (Ap4A) HIT family hydrolase
MARWTDAAAWADLTSGRSCPICVRGAPTHVIAELPGCWLTMADHAPPALPGTCALFFRRHVVELHDLGADEAAQFMAAIQSVSRCLLEASGALKINVEVHGNTIPHLHMHFFPRFRGDPFEAGPIDPKRAGGDDEFRRHLAIRRALITALAGQPQTPKGRPPPSR